MTARCSADRRLKPPFELVADGHLALRVRGRRVGGRGEPDLHDLPVTSPPGGAVTGTDEQAMEPRVEWVGVAQTTQVQPGLQEGVLDGVGCLLVVAEDEPGRRVQAVRSAGRQRGEGTHVALLRPYHRVTRHSFDHRRGDPPAALVHLGPQGDGLFHLWVLARAGAARLPVAPRQPRMPRPGAFAGPDPGTGRPAQPGSTIARARRLWRSTTGGRSRVTSRPSRTIGRPST